MWHLMALTIVGASASFVGAAVATFNPANSGGYYMVVYIGVAGPLKTPLIGPPQPL